MTYRFFWGGDEPCSNFYPAKFTYKGINFVCSEQAYMWEKALWFGDFDMASKILVLPTPGQHKKAGRLVKNFDDALWSLVKEEVMYMVVLEKFRQNEELKTGLLNTGDSILVEDSPYDAVWGIGMRRFDVGVTDPSNWKGKNLLGKVLMKVRDKLYGR